jgi:hypothetical protein
MLGGKEKSMLPIAAAAPLTALAGQGAAALAGGVGQAIASAVDPAAIAYRKQLKKDVTALREGKLGLSEAEKRTMLAGTQRSLQAQTAGLEANLRRAAAAQGGFGRSGAQTAALGQLAAGQQEQMARAASTVDQQSQALAQQRFGDIMERLAAKRKEAREAGAAMGEAAQMYGAETAVSAKQIRESRLGEGAEMGADTQAAPTQGTYLSYLSRQRKKE